MTREEISEKINEICQTFVNSNKTIDECIEEYENYIDIYEDWNVLVYWFDKNKLKQLLSYLSENKIKKFKLNIYPVFDGRYGYCPVDLQEKLVLHIVKPVKSSGFWLEPECHTPSGGNYMNTRCDITIL